MRKLAFIAIILLLFSAHALSAEFWASKKSTRYHYPDCKSALRIKSGNLVKFESPEEAKKAGYVPCKICKPPAR